MTKTSGPFEHGVRIILCQPTTAPLLPSHRMEQLRLAANQAVRKCRLLPYYRLPETGKSSILVVGFLNHIHLAAGWLTTHPKKQEISPHLKCK